MVRVMDGEFAGVEGRVARVSGQQRVVGGSGRCLPDSDGIHPQCILGKGCQ